VDMVMRPKDRKNSKNSMLKALFKKKEKGDRVSVLA
jgi:hypothetical protein